MVANSASSALAANATLLGTAWVNLDKIRLPIPSSALSSFKFYLLKLHADFQVTMTQTNNVPELNCGHLRYKLAIHGAIAWSSSSKTAWYME